MPYSAQGCMTPFLRVDKTIEIIYVLVAQLVEHKAENFGVAGSSPV